MSVGKDSLLRAANAEAKNTETKAEPVKPTEEAKAPAEVKETAKAEAPVKKPAAKKAPAKKPAAPKKTTTRKKSVKTSVLTPENSEELQAAFVKGKEPEEVNGPVHVNEELPVYLL